MHVSGSVPDVRALPLFCQKPVMMFFAPLKTLGVIETACKIQQRSYG